MLVCFSLWRTLSAAHSQPATPPAPSRSICHPTFFVFLRSPIFPTSTTHDHTLYAPRCLP